MTPGLYHPGASAVHRAPASSKVLAVFAGGTLLLLTSDLRVIAAAGAGVTALYGVARIPLPVAVAQLRPTVVVLLLIGVAQWLTAGAVVAAAICLRLATLIGLAALVTLTTRVSEMVAVVERALRPLGRVGLPVARIGLAVSLALRFLPMLTRVVGEVREAQRARGLERSTLALAVPVLVRALHMADQMADAIDARSGGA